MYSIYRYMSAVMFRLKFKHTGYINNNFITTYMPLLVLKLQTTI